jgi:hypothetical protein
VSRKIPHDTAYIYSPPFAVPIKPRDDSALGGQLVTYDSEHCCHFGL